MSLEFKPRHDVNGQEIQVGDIVSELVHDHTADTCRYVSAFTKRFRVLYFTENGVKLGRIRQDGESKSGIELRCPKAEHLLRIARKEEIDFSF